MAGRGGDPPHHGQDSGHILPRRARGSARAADLDRPAGIGERIGRLDGAAASRRRSQRRRRYRGPSCRSCRRPKPDDGGPFAFPTDNGVVTFNHPRIQAAEVPAANGISTARGLARLYAGCVSEIDGPRILMHSSIDDAIRVQSRGDQLFGPPDAGFGGPASCSTLHPSSRCSATAASATTELAVSVRSGTTRTESVLPTSITRWAGFKTSAPTG